MSISLKSWGKAPAFSTVFCLALCFPSPPVSAEYQDPIDLPSIKVESAKDSLLLDVEYLGGKLVAIGERGHVLLSRNSGEEWEQANVPSRSHLNAITFVNGKDGWAVGEDRTILHTSDGGANWTHQFDGRDADLKGPLLDVLFLSKDEGFAIGVFNLILHTMDGGETWEPWQSHIDNPIEWHLFGMADTAALNIYISSEKGLVFRSVDGGESFQRLETGHQGTFHGVLAKTGPDGSDDVIVFGVGGVIYVSSDNGNEWTRLETPTEIGLAGGTWLKDGSALIVGADGIVLHVDPGLSTVRKSSIGNGLPLSNVAAVGKGDVAIVGLAGIDLYPLLELFNQK